MTYLSLFTDACESAFRTKNHPEYLGVDHNTYAEMKDEILGGLWGTFYISDAALNNSVPLTLVNPVTREVVPVDVWNDDVRLFVLVTKPYKESES